MLSTGRDFAEFSRPTAFSKYHRPHFSRKIAADGRHFTCPPAATDPDILTCAAVSHSL